MLVLAAVPARADRAVADDGATSKRVVARYAGGEITTAEVAEWRLVYGAPDGLDDEGGAVDPYGATDAELEAIAVQTALAHAAEERGLAARATVRTALWWHEISLLEEALRRHWTDRLTLSAGALDEAVAAAGDRFDQPRRVRLRNLLVAVPDEADAARRDSLRARAEALRRQVVEGADITALARDVSDSQSRWRDGLVGWIRPGVLDPALEEVAFALEPGEVSPVLDSPRGFLILYCEDVRDAQVASSDEVRAKLRRQLRRRALLDRVAALRAEALAAARIDLEALDASPESVSGAAVEAGAGDVAKDDVVVGSDGWRLDVASARALLALAGSDDSVRENEPSARATLEEAVYRQRAAQQARAVGLADVPRTAALLVWTRRARLTALETKARVEERFEPLDDAAVRAYFERHRARYRQPETFRFGLIRVSAPAAELAERSAVLESVARRIADGSLSFDEAARRHSELPSATRGGTTGWLSAQQVAGLGPTVSRAIQSLDDGETSGLVRQGEGLRGDSTLWIVRRLGRRPPRERDFDEARERAANDLGTEHARALQAQIHRELLAELALRRTGDQPLDTERPGEL